MKGLTLTQPWATAIANGWKMVETRSWRTHYQGTIAIHAAKGFPRDARAFASDAGFNVRTLPLSSIIATAQLIGCRRTEDVAHQLDENELSYGDYTPGRWAWFLTDIRRLSQPVPCKGALSLWTVPEDIAACVHQFGGAR